jgi:hypothetical protein
MTGFYSHRLHHKLRTAFGKRRLPFPSNDLTSWRQCLFKRVRWRVTRHRPQVPAPSSIQFHKASGGSPRVRLPPPLRLLLFVCAGNPTSRQAFVIVTMTRLGWLSRRVLEICSNSAFVKVALMQRLPRATGRILGLVAPNENEPGTPGAGRMRVDEYKGCSASPDTVPVRQSCLTRSTGCTVASRPALQNANSRLLAEHHSLQALP